MQILYDGEGHSDAYQRYLVCKTFGWDYYTYEKQPSSFIEEIVLIMYQEAKKQKSEINKANPSVGGQAK